MPLHQIAQRRLQRRPVQLPLKPHRQRDHIGRAAPPPHAAIPAFQTVQEPQPALRIRQRDLGRPRLPTSAARAAAAAPAPCACRQPPPQRRNARRLEQAADRHLDIQRRPDPADQPRRQQRVAAELEEVVVDADPLDAQHLGKQRAQHLLLRRARQPTQRRDGASSGAGSARRSSLPFGVSGSRSSTTIADGTM